MKDNQNEVQDLFDEEGMETFDDMELEEEFDAGEEAPAAAEDEEDDDEYDYDYEEDLEEEDDGLFTRKSSRKDSSDHGSGNKKGLIIGIVIALIVIALIAAFFVTRGGKNGEKTFGGSKQTTAETTAAESGSSEMAADTSAATLAADTHPDIKTLVEQYYAAVQNADLAALSAVIDTTENISVQKMEKRAEYIESYSNFTCYTLDGMTEGSYLVFVAFDMKFVNIDTLAPALDYYYVNTSEDGNLYICTEWTQEEDAFIAEQSKTAEVQNLSKEVNDRFAAAMDADAKLAELVQLLNSGASGSQPTTAAPEETTAEPEETTAAPEETTAAPEETTAAPETTVAAGGNFAAGSLVWAVAKYTIRGSASTDGESRGEIFEGDHAKVVESGSEWTKLEYKNADGETIVGYVRNDGLTATSPE